LPGYIAGEALTNPSVLKAAETGIRGGGGLLARLAASPLARVVTGPVGTIASSIFDAGHAPLGHSAEATAHKQTADAIRYKNLVNQKSGGRPVIEGSTTEEILESIRRYRAGR
jgi:hypothetical protein